MHPKFKGYENAMAFLCFVYFQFSRIPLFSACVLFICRDRSHAGSVERVLLRILVLWEHFTGRVLGEAIVSSVESQYFVNRKRFHCTREMIFRKQGRSLNRDN